MFTLIIAIIFLVFLIIGHEFGHFIAAKLLRLRVDEFGFGFPPRIFGKKVGETVYSFNAIPFGGFVKICGENPNEKVLDKDKSFQNLPALKKSLVVAAGAVMNLLIGWVVISMVFMIGMQAAVFIGKVTTGSPADVVGLREGDKITDFKNTSEFISFIEVNRGKEIKLNVSRGSESLVLKIIPRVSPPAGEGPLGVSLIEGGIQRHNFLGALYEGGVASIKILIFIFMSLFSLIVSLFSGELGVAAGVTGPVGIFNFLDTAGKLGIAYLLQILGLISLNLAAINIIPFPALDGGRLFFIFCNKIFRGRLNPRFETATHALGFAILILLMIIVTIKDIMNLV